MEEVGKSVMQQKNWKHSGMTTYEKNIKYLDYIFNYLSNTSSSFRFISSFSIISFEIEIIREYFVELPLSSSVNR